MLARFEKFVNGFFDQKQSSMILSPGGSTIFATASYVNFARDAYKKNELVYAAITRKIETFNEATFRVKGKDGNEIPGHPLVTIIKNPKRGLGEYNLWFETLMHLDLGGNAFWLKIRGSRGQMIGISPIRPDRIRKIVTKDEEEVLGYTIQKGGQGPWIPYDRDDVVHFRNPDPLDNHWGMPPLQAAQRTLSIDNLSNEMTEILVKNRGINPGIVVTTEGKIDEATVSRLNSTWEERFSGKRSGKPAWLQKGMDIKMLGLNMNELAWIDLRAVSETRILSVLKVPPMLIGAKSGIDKGTFSNMAEARLSFHHETIAPMYNKMDDVIQAEILNTEFKGDGVAYFDTSEISAMQGQRDARWDRAGMALDRGFVTVNEARAIVGHESVAGGDVFLRGLGKLEVGEGQTSADVMRETVGVTQLSGKTRETKSARSAVALLTEIFGRRRVADAFLQKFTSLAADLYGQFASDVSKIAENTQKSIDTEVKEIPQQFVDGFIDVMKRKEADWIILSGSQSLPVMAEIVGESGRLTSAAMGVSFDLSSDEIVASIRTNSFKFAKSISRTASNRVMETILASRETGATIKELRNSLREEFDGWTKHRAEMVARTETIRASNSGAKTVYKKAGVTKIRWLAVDDSCPYCLALQDKGDFPIDDPFVEEGGSLEIDDEKTPPLVANYEAIETPPAHPNCRCAIVPAD